MGQIIVLETRRASTGQVDTHVFTALKALQECHSDCRASLHEEVRAPDSRDWASLNATCLLELDKGELLWVGLRAFSWAFREHGAVVVVRALPSVTRGPEACAVPVKDHCGPSLGRSRGLSWTRNLVAGDLEKITSRVSESPGDGIGLCLHLGC